MQSYEVPLISAKSAQLYFIHYSFLYNAHSFPSGGLAGTEGKGLPSVCPPPDLGVKMAVLCVQPLFPVAHPMDWLSTYSAMSAAFASQSMPASLSVSSALSSASLIRSFRGCVGQHTSDGSRNFLQMLRATDGGRFAQLPADGSCNRQGMLLHRHALRTLPGWLQETSRFLPALKKPLENLVVSREMATFASSNYSLLYIGDSATPRVGTCPAQWRQHAKDWK